MSQGTKWILLSLAMAAFVAGCRGNTDIRHTPTPQSTTSTKALVLFGPPGFKSIFTAFKPFVANTDWRYEFQFLEGTSIESGVTGVLNGTFDLMVLMRHPLPDEPLAYTEFVQTPVGIFVNPDIGITDLTREQVARIFAGEITNWSEIGGPDQAIVVFIQKPEDSMTYAVQDFILDGYLFADSATVLLEERVVFSLVESMPGSISYASWAGKKYWEFIFLTEFIDAVDLDGWSPDDPEYPFVSSIGLAYLPERRPDLQPLFDWGYDFLDSAVAQTLLGQFGVRLAFELSSVPK